MMSSKPNKITVKDMLNLSQKLANQGHSKEGRTKRHEKDTLYENQIKDILMWKCFHSLVTEKKVGRPRKFYLCKTYVEEVMTPMNPQERNLRLRHFLILNYLTFLITISFSLCKSKWLSGIHYLCMWYWLAHRVCFC